MSDLRRDVPGPASRSKEQHGETTLVVEPARLVEACDAPARRARASTSSPTSPPSTTSAGASAGVSGYIGTAGRPRPEHADDAGLPGRCPQPKPKRFAMNYHLLAVARARRARVRLQTWVDEGEPVPSVIDVWPTADWHEREAWDLMGIRDRRPPEPEADPPRRRLGRPPAAQGLPARRRAGALLGGGVDGRRTAAAHARARRSTRARASRSPIPTVLTTSPEMLRDRRRDDRQLRPEPPVDARRAAPDRRPLRRGRDRARGGDRLPAHRLREEHGAEDVVEVHHVPGAHRLRLVPEQRVRLRRARSRSCSTLEMPPKAIVDAHAASAS